jgi:hypothetical protein
LLASDWHEVLALADALLEIAPDCVPARTARVKAWEAVGMKATQVHRSGQPAGGQDGAIELVRAAGEASPASGQQPIAGEKLLMWIDAVGGFLVCLGDQIVLGPPAPDAQVDVPILADISRRHAVIHREGSDYLIEPLRGMRLDGRAITKLSALGDGSLLELGEGVELRFRRPHPLSATARLEMVSRHRTEPAVDAIVLMAETCVLGPGWQSHVVCRPWSRELILYRRGTELCCRTEAPFTVGGRACQGHAPLGHGSRIEGDDFSLSIEGLPAHSA